MDEHLLKCPKCGAVMIEEDYHKHGWYLDGKKQDRCPSEVEPKEAVAAGLEKPPGRRRKGRTPSSRKA
jgi:hypothetical protein